MHRRAVRLEWWTITFFVVAISALAIVLGQSQAMKAAWVEDILALAPPIAFLIANRYRNRPVDDEHPYGHHPLRRDRLPGIRLGTANARRLHPRRVRVAARAG